MDQAVTTNTGYTQYRTVSSWEVMKYKSELMNNLELFTLEDCGNNMLHINNNQTDYQAWVKQRAEKIR